MAFLYTTKSGDTIASISSKYGANADAIVAYNNYELQGNPTVGSQLVIPGGILPDNERPGYVAPRVVTTSYSSYSGGYGSEATQAISRRVTATHGATVRGMPTSVVSSLVALSVVSGVMLALGHTMLDWLVSLSMAIHLPVQLWQTVVATVTSQSLSRSIPGVSVTISEMNGYRFGGGFARVGHGDISWSEATSGMYQYIH